MSNSGIVRTPTRATGGITLDERMRLEAVAQEWIANARRTDRACPDRVREAMTALYAAADLPAPRVVLVPSPLVMAFAGGAASAVWNWRNAVATGDATDDAVRAATHAAVRDATYAATHAATDDATHAAVRDATHAATYAATDDATDSAVRDATHAAVRDATYAATDAAVRAATHAAVRDATGDATGDATHAAVRDAVRDATSAIRKLAVGCTQRWCHMYQGGNMWAGYESFISGTRDVLGLELPEHENYAHWERAAKVGGFRMMHEKFCIVSDFPETLKFDDLNRPHCEDGPSHRWRDGWELFHWHGVRVPDHWITQRDTLDAAEVLAHENVEVRAAGAEIVGWDRMSAALDRRVIDGDPDTDIGALVEMTLPGLAAPGRFLMALCPRNGTICEGVPRTSDVDDLPIETAIAAQAWRDGLAQSEYQHPKLRT